MPVLGKKNALPSWTAMPGSAVAYILVTYSPSKGAMSLEYSTVFVCLSSFISFWAREFTRPIVALI